MHRDTRGVGCAGLRKHVLMYLGTVLVETFLYVLVVLFELPEGLYFDPDHIAHRRAALELVERTISSGDQRRQHKPFVWYLLVYVSVSVSDSDHSIGVTIDPSTLPHRRNPPHAPHPHPPTSCLPLAAAVTNSDPCDIGRPHFGVRTPHVSQPSEPRPILPAASHGRGYGTRAMPMPHGPTSFPPPHPPPSPPSVATPTTLSFSASASAFSSPRRTHDGHHRIDNSESSVSTPVRLPRAPPHQYHLPPMMSPAYPPSRDEPLPERISITVPHAACEAFEEKTPSVVDVFNSSGLGDYRVMPGGDSNRRHTNVGVSVVEKRSALKKPAGERSLQSWEAGQGVMGGAAGGRHTSALYGWLFRRISFGQNVVLGVQ